MSFSRQLHLGDVGATLDVTFLLWFLIIFGHVVRAAVADLDCISAEYLV